MLSLTGDPTRSKLRVFAATSLAVGALFILLAWRSGPLEWSKPSSLWLAGPLLLIGTVGTIAPMLVGGVYRVAMVITKPIGFVVAQIILAILYFVVVVPLAAALRLTGYDPLQRQPPGQWIKRTARPRSKRHYLRQY